MQDMQVRRGKWARCFSMVRAMAITANRRTCKCWSKTFIPRNRTLRPQSKSGTSPSKVARLKSKASTRWNPPRIEWDKDSTQSPLGRRLSRVRAVTPPPDRELCRSFWKYLELSASWLKTKLQVDAPYQRRGLLEPNCKHVKATRDWAKATTHIQWAKLSGGSARAES